MKFASRTGKNTRQTKSESSRSYSLSSSRLNIYNDAHSRIMNNPDLPKVVHDIDSRQHTEQSYPEDYRIERNIPQNPYSRAKHEYEEYDDGVIEGEHTAYAEPEYADEVYPAENIPAEAPVNKSPVHKKKRFKGLKIIGAVTVFLAAFYLFLVYTSIPFIANLRTLYVETAMMTMSHQWLATAFLPKSVIEDFRSSMEGYESIQENVESDWNNYGTITYTKLPSITLSSPAEDDDPETDDANESEDQPSDESELPFWMDPESAFYQVYYEIDFDSFCAYAEEHKDSMFDENGNLFIDEADLDAKGTGIVTTNGDPVLSIDTVNGIIIARLSGSEYHGALAIVKDPTMVGIAVTDRLGVVGEKIGKIAEKSNAVLAINASGFEDPDGLGNGGIVHGLLYRNGEKLKGSAGGNYKAIFFDSNYRLNVTSYSSKLDIYNGIEFKPALVVNGEAAVTGSFGWGIQPRTAIGQTEDGSVIMIVINGRSASSVGITVGSLAQIFLDYGAVQAGNLDGGSSSVMYYNGRIITAPCGGDKVNGRYLPDAFVVYRKSAEELSGSEIE